METVFSEPAMQLHIRGVSKTYANGVQALKDVTLTILREMYGLLGPNGAGKSTLMRMIATLQEPFELTTTFSMPFEPRPMLPGAEVTSR